MATEGRLKREWRFLTGLRRTLARVSSISGDSPNLACDDLETAIDKHRDRTALLFEGRTWTYGELDALANRYAHWGRGLGLLRGQTVAIFLPNRPDYLAAWFGLSKIGVAAALINNHLTGPALAHCLRISGAAHCVVDDETLPAFEAAKPLLEQPMSEWVLGSSEPQGRQRDLDQALKSCSQLRPDREVRAGMTARDVALYIYTSGTTGLPKAAKVTHTRAQLYMRGFAGATGAEESDRIYIALPLYHATGGLCAVGAALLNGASISLKTKFSASHFWSDIAAEQCTMFVYIGELCRYLVNQPLHEDEAWHKLRLAFGNGLRPDIWQEMTDRFRIPQVLEFYGATEGNVSMFNFDGKPGAIGRAPAWLRGQFNIRLVKFDIDAEAPARGPDGLCIECAPGEIGECVGKIGHDARTAYSGYVDKAASDKKILRDVLDKGDAWFATGDLMRQDKDGYFYFVDRVGDTFRWKGENVSTGEVAERLAGAPGVLEVNSYGVPVPGAEGRAGMVGLVVEPGFDIAAFQAHAESALPAYAQPLFVRLLPALETTGTFKYRKIDLVAEGFAPSEGRTLWVKDPAAGYVELTPAVFDAINAGRMRL